MLEERVTRFLHSQAVLSYRKPCTYSPVTWGCAGGRVSPRSQASSHGDTQGQPKPPLV